MDVVSVGNWKLIKAFPPNTKLLLGWNAIWKFGDSIQINNEWIDPIPYIYNNVFSVKSDPIQALSKPGSEIPIVILLQLFEAKPARQGNKHFSGTSEIVVAKADGTAWQVNYWKFQKLIPTKWRQPTTEEGVVLDGLGFNIFELIDQQTFSKLVSKLKTAVRKL